MKSETIALVYIYVSSLFSLIFCRAYYILALLLDITQMLKPKEASYWQKPRPIPSEPPVTTAHVFLPYLYGKFLDGRMALMRLQSSFAIQMTKTMPPMAARK